MRETITDRVQRIEQDAEDVVALHFAAMRVMDSTQGGGRGTFRIDGLSDELAAALPTYIKGFEGERLPRLFYGEEGELKQGGGVLVDERYSRFKQISVDIDEATGETQRLFRWDRELWDYEAAQTENDIQQRAERRGSQIKWGRRAVIALAGLAEVVGMGLAFKGAIDVTNLREQNAPQAQIESADDMNAIGNYVMTGGMLVAYTAAGSYFVEGTIKGVKNGTIRLRKT